MASAIGNPDNAATGAAEASSHEHLKEFYEQISTDSVINLVWEVGSGNHGWLGTDGRRFYKKRIAHLKKKKKEELNVVYFNLCVN